MDDDKRISAFSLYIYIRRLMYRKVHLPTNRDGVDSDIGVLFYVRGSAGGTVINASASTNFDTPIVPISAGSSVRITDYILIIFSEKISFY